MKSVAMAYYNGAKYIDEQIRSILANMEDTDELIISVDDASDGRILLEHGLRGSLVAQIYLLEGRAHTRDLLDAVEHLYLGVGKVVDDDHVVASLDQFHGGMAADEARSARH